MQINEIIQKEKVRLYKLVAEQAEKNRPLALVNGNPRELITTIGTRLLLQRNQLGRQGENAFVIDDCNRNAINELVNYLLRTGRFADQPMKGLLIRGEVGCGKTLLMEILKVIFYYQWKVINLVPAIDLADACQRNNQAVIDRANRGIVCLDDLGQEASSVKTFGSERYPLIETLTHRYIHRRLTFVTTNFTPAEIEQRYGNRIRDRLREMMHEIILPGGSRRR